ncbi:hypothetical protein B4589_010400 [Halolamina sp. CBA1230]|uniref:hypothetical protein n=1 Tax=Halolamina sp. CBA1230 TaxID=1853690 RepID=UPI001301D1AC|nr:hypothetical protein [Halolamina sp. CBA1230]QKY20766.1 hypothetical protein B4589_010400 [Halolamina sp. CBA1230]
MSTDSSERAREPVEHDDESTLTVSQTESTAHETSRPRSSDVPDGDSILLRLARYLGIR